MSDELFVIFIVGWFVLLLWFFIKLNIGMWGKGNKEGKVSRWKHF